MNRTKSSLWPVVGSVAVTVLMLAALVTLLVQTGPVTRLEVAAIVMATIAMLGWALLSGLAIGTRVIDRRDRRRTAEQIVQEKVDAGELVRLPGGGLVDAGWAAQLDPEAKR